MSPRSLAEVYFAALIRGKNFSLAQAAWEDFSYHADRHLTTAPNGTQRSGMPRGDFFDPQSTLAFDGHLFAI
jgi:hypothetical protein